jgi:hypothetical protein
MSNSNRVPNGRAPFAICYHCDTAEVLTKASEDGWTLLFRHHRMCGYLCPTCQVAAEQAADGAMEAAPAVIRQHSRQSSRSQQ